MYSRETCVKFVISIFFLIGLLILPQNTVTAGNAQSSKVYGVAIDGYDPVAYFTESRPVKGSSEYSYTWNQAQWHFSNPQHREMFADNPEKYTPKRGGFWAESLIAGKVAKHNPEEWTIKDGSLYLGWEWLSQLYGEDGIFRQFFEPSLSHLMKIYANA